MSVGFAPTSPTACCPAYCQDNHDLVQTFWDSLQDLQASHYPYMRDQIENLLKPNETLVSEYPDFTTNSSGGRCDAIGADNLNPLHIVKSAAERASTTVSAAISGALQNQVAQARDRGLAWNYVGGVAAEWTGPGYGHGYCVGEADERDPRRWCAHSWTPATCR